MAVSHHRGQHCMRHVEGGVSYLSPCRSWKLETGAVARLP